MKPSHAAAAGMVGGRGVRRERRQHRRRRRRWGRCSRRHRLRLLLLPHHLLPEEPGAYGISRRFPATRI